MTNYMNFVSEKIKEQQTKVWDKELLDIEYWKNLILSYL